jgi:tetratricopeptide (TPR) repeat protein
MNSRKTDPKGKSSKDAATKADLSGRLFETVFLPWTGVLILLHLAAMYVAPAYLWGVDFYHFFPLWIGWLAVLISLALLVPGVAEALYPGLETVAKKISRPFARWNQNTLFVLLSALSLPVFWFLRDRLHLLGDGMFRLIDLPNGKVHLQEWLDAVIHVLFYRMMIKVVPSWTPQLTYAVISVACGAAFVFLALKLSSLLGRSGFAKLLIFSFLITLGSVQLFFGYAESYTILQVALSAYVLLAARYLAGKSSALPLLGVFVISVALHITSLIYVPSLIYLLWAAKKGEPTARKGLGKTISNAFLVAALIVASFLVLSWVMVVAIGLEKTGKGIFILPLLGTESYPFGMLSWAHLSEFVNQLLLLTPLGISLLLFFFFFKVKHGEFKDKLINFLALASVFGLVYLFVVNFTLGSADWDLRSSPAVFFGLLGVLAFLRWGEKAPLPSAKESEGDKPSSSGNLQNRLGGLRSYRAWGLIFIWLGLFHTVPWILTNASQSESVARYVTIQEVDPHPVDETNYNLYKVARVLKWADKPWDVVWMYQRAVQRNPLDTLSYYNLAAQYHHLQELDSAQVVLDSLFKIDPVYPRANWLMGNILRRKGQPAQALVYLERTYDYLQDNPDYLYEMGLTYLKADQILAAGGCGMQILKLDPNYIDAYYLLGAAYFATGDVENARESWERILSAYPGDSVATENLKHLDEILSKKP